MKQCGVKINLGSIGNVDSIEIFLFNTICKYIQYIKYIYIYVYTYIYIHIYVYVYIYVCVFVCVCFDMCIDIHNKIEIQAHCTFRTAFKMKLKNVEQFQHIKTKLVVCPKTRTSSEIRINREFLFAT